MFQLTYISEESQPFSEDGLISLLEQARNRNLTLDITGLLVYANGTFLQTLEGEPDHVHAVYESIVHDFRNRNNRVLYERPIDARRFPGWAMGFQRMSDHDLRGLPGYTEYLDRRPEGWELPTLADSVHSLFATFRAQSQN